jgi:hypothetical protein
MRPDLIIIGGITLQNATQLRFVEHDEMIETFGAVSMSRDLALRLFGP